MAWRDFSPTILAQVEPRRFPPLQRAQIIRLACLEPVARGLHITHWSSGDLARQAVADGIVRHIDASTVRRLLREVDLQPHRTRYWKTSRVDAKFKDRAEKVLWCYGNADRFASRGVWTVAVDEVPNFQVLEREPIRRSIIGSVEQQEFEYVRHGTVNLLFFLIVHSGRMDIAIEPRKDSENYVRALRDFKYRNRRRARGAFLIQDGDPSHTAANTREYLENCGGWWRPRITPPHASWLNQAELLIQSFSHRYLRRTSWRSATELALHVLRSRAEYNKEFARPIEWTWNNVRMREWYARHRSRKHHDDEA